MQHISISTESNLYCIVCYVLTSSVSDSFAMSRRLEVVTFRLIVLGWNLAEYGHIQFVVRKLH